MKTFSSSSDTGNRVQRTWLEIREHMSHQYGKHYTPIELRLMEIKWRRIFSAAGWSVKGM